MNIRKLMKEKVSRVSISSKMSIVMTVSIVLILTVFLGVNRYYNSFFVYQKLENASLTYLDSIDRMMENLVDTLDGYSRICFSNAGVQELLDKNSSGQVDFSLQDNVNNYLWELVVNVKQIESIYLYSNNGLVASADRQELHYPRYRCIKDYEWYDEEEYGEYHVDFSSDDFYRKGDMPEISFRRAVRSTTNFKKIGYMIMTVSSDVLKDFLVADNADKYERVFCLLNNEESVIVISDNVYMDEMQKIGKDMIQNEKTMVLRNMFDEKYMFCILKSEEGYYMDAISVEDAYQRNREKSLVDIALIILQAMLTLVCIVMISKLYTRPIKELMIAMRCLQNGVFQPVKMNSAHYEIQELIHVYNEMVKKINELLEKTKEAERLKGKADLKVLTAQINPHFLYNTFDSIKALFVLKRYDDAYAMIDALSRFYKINLSKGDDFITIEKNLVMLKSYIDIQQMRFGGEFEYIYSVDPEIMQWKILKFALQPLVENAINHGIHGFTTEGIINLDIVRTGEKSLKITLMDNGRGMSKEALKKAISGEEGRNGKSFGLFATLHRLQYCYGDRIWWSIESEENGGTSPIAVDAFHAGKHVMCEKPMAINTAEAEKMMTAWKESGKKFSIGYQNRYRADVRHLRSACQNGDLGEIYYAKAYAIRRRGVPTWGSFIQGSQQGGGPLIDIGTHSLDLALWLMDNYDVESVTGTVFKKLGKLPQATDGNLWGAWDTSKYDVEDSAIGYIKMKSGALVVLESSWALNILEAREAEVTLCGTKAGAELRNQKEVIYNRGKYGRLTEEVLTPGEPHDFFGTRYDAPYLEAKEWLTAILEDRDPLVRPEQSLVVTQVLDAIYESAAKNETVWF